MSLLPYHKVDEIKDALRQVELENLVAVFSRANESGCLLIYNQDVPSTGVPEMAQVISLRDMPDLGLSGLDGPILGLSAIDVIRPDVLTKGPGFYAIERLFLERGRQAALHRTIGFARRRHLGATDIVDLDGAAGRLLRRCDELVEPYLGDDVGRPPAVHGPDFNGLRACRDRRGQRCGCDG